MPVADRLPLPFSRVDQRAGRLAATFVALGAFVLLSFAPSIYNDGDTGWHLAAGRLFIDSFAVPATDPFSYTAVGVAWTAHEWLAEVIMASALAIGGWPLPSMVAGLALGLSMLVIGNELARWLDPPKVLITLAVVLIVLMPSMLARPHLFAWPLLAGWTVIMLHAREAQRAPPLPAAALMILWANLHASFIFGLFVAGMLALEAVIAGPDRRAAVIGWGRFGVLALAACLLTPHGIAGLLYPLQVSNMAALATIHEWQPTQLSQHLTFAFPFFLALFILLLHGAKVPPVRLLLLCVMLFLAFLHIRHQQMLAIVGSLILAAPLDQAFGRRPTATPPRWLVPALGIILAFTVLIRVALPGSRPNVENNPGTAIAHVPGAMRQQHMINEYGFGGSLIFAGMRPFIDGRADMYGDRFTLAADRISKGDMAEFQAAVDRWQVSWTIFMPKSPIVARLDGSPGWQRFYADKWAVIHVRRAKPEAAR